MAFCIQEGEKSKEGNQNLRLVNLNNQWHLRINLGNGEYVWAKAIRSVKRKTDKWLDFISSLEHAEKTGDWFPYAIRLKLRNGENLRTVQQRREAPRSDYHKRQWCHRG
jgi:hypothetical protein